MWITLILSFLVGASGKVVWRAECQHISSVSFATNKFGLTFSFANKTHVEFLAYSDRESQFLPTWRFTPPSRDSNQSAFTFGAHHFERNDPGQAYNMSGTDIDTVAVSMNQGAHESVEFYGTISNASGYNQTGQWQYIVQGE
jgi:hypothetical protein